MMSLHCCCSEVICIRRHGRPTAHHLGCNGVHIPTPRHHHFVCNDIIVACITAPSSACAILAQALCTLYNCSLVAELVKI